MFSNKNLEIELQELLRQKNYSKIVLEITTKTNEKTRSSSLCNLLGICRITNNRNNKDIVTLAIKDFKHGFLVEKNAPSAIDSLTNFIISSVLLYDLEGNNEFSFEEIINFYKETEKLTNNHRAIHVAMTMVYRRLNNFE